MSGKIRHEVINRAKRPQRSIRDEREKLERDFAAEWLEVFDPERSDKHTPRRDRHEPGTFGLASGVRHMKK